MTMVINRRNLRSATACPLAVVDFWAPWCGPCKMMRPVMQRLERRFPRIRFGRLNVQHQQDLARRYRIYSIPSLVVFERGRAHEKVTGYYPYGALAEFLKQKVAEVDR